MKRFINDIKKFWNYTVYSAKSDLKSEVAGSFLSWLWWILDPLLYMLVYSFVAVVVFGSGEKYFPVFVFIGLNTWQFFSKTVKASVKLVSGRKSIVTKVYVPKFIFILERMGLYGFKMMVSFGLTVVFMIFYRVPVTLKVLWMIPLFAVLGIVTFAASTIICHFGVFVEDLLNVVTVVLQLGFYLSGIFYSIENRIGRHSELVATLLTKPITKLTAFIKDMPKDKLVKCEIDSRDEVGDLVVAFNDLIEKVDELEEKRRSFVSDASHELKTPLSIIKLLSDSLIQTPNPDPAFVREFLNDMGAEVERLTRIVQRLLDLTKMDQTNQMQIDMISVNEIAEDVFEKLTPLAQNKEIIFTLHKPGDDVLIPVDRDSITEAIYNIADNSIKYTENGEVLFHDTL